MQVNRLASGVGGSCHSSCSTSAPMPRWCAAASGSISPTPVVANSVSAACSSIPSHLLLARVCAFACAFAIVPLGSAPKQASSAAAESIVPLFRPAALQVLKAFSFAAATSVIPFATAS